MSTPFNWVERVNRWSQLTVIEVSGFNARIDPIWKPKQSGTHSGKRQELLRTNPIPRLQQYKVLRLYLGRTTVDEELDSVDKAGIAGGEEEGDGRDLLRAAHLAARNL